MFEQHLDIGVEITGSLRCEATQGITAENVKKIHILMLLCQ